jgi:glycosyltransferase involved in cell wall biosynthesis
MRILFIVPGSGDSFYCGNCFRDNLQANALRKAGHDVIIMPLYLPFKYPSFKADTPLFFPATTFYAAQKFFTNRTMPRWIERILGSGLMLNIAATFSGTTSASGLEDITLSMIHGDDAVFRHQVNVLTGWIEKMETPDIIHLSSTLVIGIAKAIKQRMEIPIVCSLQDEEVWIDSLDKNYPENAWDGIVHNLKYIDKFVTTSEFYKNMVSSRLPQITDVNVIYPGVNTAKYASTEYPETPVIGFFYRMNEINGLGLLAEAFVKLKKRDTIKGLKLEIAGGYSSEDKRFVKKVRKILSPYINDVTIHHSYNPEEHADFYRRISLICNPLTFDEGVGLYLCEAFAAGRPAVEPATGSFKEIVDNAGIIYSPDNGDSLADAIEKLLTDKKRYLSCCENALTLSRTRYTDMVMANKLLNTYEELRAKN